METLPVRLHPGDDLRRALEAVLVGRGLQAGFVLAGIGSLRPAQLRFAGAAAATAIDADVEILTLGGSLGADGSHLHLAVSCPDGRVIGGHAAYGCTVRTTAEVLIALLPDWRFTREPDAATGYAELVVARRDGAGGRS
jgi:predicted DNA-binding protein with PD1-like motif